jgi:hypothetical protein
MIPNRGKHSGKSPWLKYFDGTFSRATKFMKKCGVVSKDGKKRAVWHDVEKTSATDDERSAFWKYCVADFVRNRRKQPDKYKCTDAHGFTRSKPKRMRLPSWIRPCAQQRKCSRICDKGCNDKKKCCGYQSAQGKKEGWKGGGFLWLNKGISAQMAFKVSTAVA